MKKLIAFLILCVSLAVSCNDDLLERVEALEKATSVSLKSSISTLESQYLNLKIQIAALNLKDNTGQITALELLCFAVPSLEGTLPDSTAKTTSCPTPSYSASKTTARPPLARASKTSARLTPARTPSRPYLPRQR